MTIVGPRNSCRFNELTRVIPPPQCCENNITKKIKESKALLKQQEKAAMMIDTESFSFCLFCSSSSINGKRRRKARRGDRIETLVPRKWQRNDCDRLLIAFNVFRTWQRMAPRVVSLSCPGTPGFFSGGGECYERPKASSASSSRLH